MPIVRSNLKIEKNRDGKHPGIVPAIQNGYGAAPGLLHEVDFSVFRKSHKERMQIQSAKEFHREQLRAAYGASWKKFLNIPKKVLSQSIHIQY